MNRALTIELQRVREEAEAHTGRLENVSAGDKHTRPNEAHDKSLAQMHVHENEEDQELIPAVHLESTEITSRPGKAEVRKDMHTRTRTHSPPI